MAQNTVKLIIEANAKAAAAEFKKFSGQARASLNQVSEAASSVKGAIGGMIAAIVIRQIAGGFIETAQSMDAMKISLETITKGKGEETFRKLNAWAMKMPVNTQKATQAYIQMRAMGLDPTIAQMTTLVDTMGALGGGPDMLDTFANTLGKIKAMGKVSADEINRLAERGVPALEILQQKFNLTAKQMGDLGNAGLDADEAIQALLEGMADRFAGQSDKIQRSMAGMWETIKSEYTDYQRVVMESGVTAYIEAGLQAVIDKINELKASGDFGPMVRETADTIMTAISVIIKGIALASDASRGWQMIWEGLKASFSVGLSLIVSKMQDFISVALAASKALGMEGMTKKLEAAARELGIAQDYFTDTVEESAQAIEKMASKKSAYSQVSTVLDAMTEAARKAQAELAKVAENSPKSDTTQWTTSVSMKVTVPPEVKKYWEEQKKAVKDYEAVNKDVQDKIRQATLTTEDYKIWKVRQWEAEAIEAAKKAGKDTQEINRAAALEIGAIENEAQGKRDQANEAKKAKEQALSDQIAQMTLSETDYKVLQLARWKEKALATAEEIGRGTADIEDAYRQRKAELDAAALAASREQEQARQEEIDQRNQARFESEHQVLTSLAEAWGLTWDEIRQNQVDVWADIGQMAASATQSIASTLANIVVNSKDAGESVKNLFKNLAMSAIQTLIQIGVQRVVLSAIGNAAIGTEMAAQVFAMNAIFAAATPAAAAVSIATAGAAAVSGTAAFTKGMFAMGASSLAMKAMMSGMQMAATGAYIRKPTVFMAGEDGDEVIIPLSKKYRSQGQAIFEEIAPLFMPEPVSTGGAVGGGQGAYAQAGPVNTGSQCQIVIENNITINGSLSGDSGTKNIAWQIGESIASAVKGAIN